MSFPTSPTNGQIAKVNGIDYIYSATNNSWTIVPAQLQSPSANAAFIQANAAYNQANSASIAANTPSHVANSAAIYANGAFIAANTPSHVANSAAIYANGAFIVANTPSHVANSASIYANGAFAQANTADDKATSAGVYANGAFAAANTPSHVANSAAIYANGAFAAANTADDKATSAGVYANGAFIVANTPSHVANSAAIYANGAFAAANTPSHVANSAAIYANGAFAAANTADDKATSAGVYANGAFAAANAATGTDLTQNTSITAAFIAANSSGVYANGAFIVANAAFIRANNSVDANNGGTITGDLTITKNLFAGNVFVTGNTFSISAGTLVANDTVILLGTGNYFADTRDLGFASHYNDGTNAHSGLIRDSVTKEWYLFKGYTPEVGTNNNIDITDPSFVIDTLNANLHSTYVQVKGIDLLPRTNIIFDVANSAAIYANGAFEAANAAAGTDLTQNTSITAAFVAANSAGVYANGAFAAANVAFIHANSAFIHSNAAFDKANTGVNVFNQNLNTTNNVTFNEVTANNVYFDNLNLTGNIFNSTACSAINFVANSSGDGFGNSTIQLIPDTNLSGTDQYLIIDPTAPGHIHIRAGGTQDWSSAELFLGGEQSHVKVGAGLNPSVNITSNAYSWTFDVNGELTVPGRIYFPDGTEQNTSPYAISSYANAAFIQANTAYNRANNSLNANTGGTVTGELIATGLIRSAASAGDEGGEFQFAIPQSNTSLNGPIAIDIYQNKLRFFETTGTNRGAFIDLSAAGTGVSSDLLAGGSGADQFARNTANGAFVQANSGFIQANAAYNHANAAFNAANTAGGGADQFARDTANGAFVRANNSINANNGGTLTGNLVVWNSNVSVNVVGSEIFAVYPQGMPVIGTSSVSNITGAVRISGGLGVAGNVYATGLYDGQNSFKRVGYLNIPQSGSAKTTSYVLALGDIGEFIEVGSGGSITIPDAVFSAGDAIMIFNNTSGSITITCSITTAYIAGTDSDKATVSLAARGIASILFASGTVCVIMGNVS